MRQLKIIQRITNRTDHSLDRYLQEINRLEMVTMEEEVELARRIKEGDHAALEKLTKANLRFVVSVAKQYQNRGMSLGDLISEGNIGLIKAVQRFDETRGFKFISYAVWWIRQSIIQALAEKSRLVRQPSNRLMTLNKIVQKKSELEQKFEREPTLEELSEELSFNVSEISSIIETSGKHVSVDAPFFPEDENGLLEVLEGDGRERPDAALVNDSLHCEIKRALSTLTQRESDVITLYFGLNNHAAISLEEIGIKFNLTRERVRQIREKATRRLRHGSRNELLRLYI